jgi:hypothetical protein
MDTVNTVIVRQTTSSPISTVVVKQTLANTVRTTVVKQTVNNPIPTVVIKRADNPVQKVIINRGPKGNPGPPGPPGPMVDEVVDVILLSSIDVANKSFSLSAVPADPSRIELTPFGGIVQIYGVDYTYLAGNIIWAGLGLEGFLEPGELILVRYLKEA